MKSIIYPWSTSIFLFVSLLSPAIPAIEPGELRLGVTGGHVGLLKDVGQVSGNGLGAGGVIGFAASEEMVFNLSYIFSEHSEASHTDLSMGVDFYLAGYDAAYANLALGASFLGNSFDELGLSGNAFGLYLGGGFDLELAEPVSIGLQARYQKVFEAEGTTIAGKKIKTVQDSVTVLVRIIFAFSLADHSNSVY